MTVTSYDVTTASTNYEGPSALVRFSLWYSGVHGYLCIAVCVFGIVSNILNIVVLTHRRMASSPTNFILTALAISDLLPMLSYLPYAVYFHCLTGVQPVPQHGFPFPWVIFLLFNNSFIISLFPSGVHFINDCSSSNMRVLAHITNSHITTDCFLKNWNDVAPFHSLKELQILGMIARQYDDRWTDLWVVRLLPWCSKE